MINRNALHAEKQYLLHGNKQALEEQPTATAQDPSKKAKISDTIKNINKKILADSFDYLIAADAFGQAGGKYDEQEHLTWTLLKSDLSDSKAIDLVELFFPDGIQDEQKGEAAKVILCNFNKHKDALDEAWANENDTGKRRAAYSKVINSWDLVTIGLISGGGVLGIVMIGVIAFFFYRRSQKTF